jgi:hypothetical protein
MSAPRLADLRGRFQDGLISQKQYDLEQKAIIKDMGDGARRGAARSKLRHTGQYMQDRSRALSQALQPNDVGMDTSVSSFFEQPRWHEDSTFNITFDSTLDEQVIRACSLGSAQDMACGSLTQASHNNGSVAPAGSRCGVQVSQEVLPGQEVQEVAKRERKNDDAYYRGVTWDNRRQVWTARLLTDGKSLSIGEFSLPPLLCCSGFCIGGVPGSLGRQMASRYHKGASR